MRVFRNPDEGRFEEDLLSFALGAIGGLAAGILVSRGLPKDLDFTDNRIGEGIRDRARSVARRLRPARLRRLAPDQREIDQLEDRVLDAFLADGILSERGIDIGAISHGIVELSGSVWNEEELDRAVALANRIPGVRTVVNRLEIEHTGRDRGHRRPLDEDELESTFIHQEGRVSGMGRRRQGASTDPDRNDDSQYRRVEALAAADREQFAEEDLAHEHSNKGRAAEVQRANRTDYSEDELDNQDPHGKHADVTLDEQPQELNTQARVGEGLKPGTELRLEHSDLSIEDKPPRDREG